MLRAAIAFAVAVCLAVPGARAAATASGATWQVVLVAGDDAQPVFDDATLTLRKWLIEQGVPFANIHLFSADKSQLGHGVALSTKAALLREIASLPVRPGGKCLVFLTSHGEHGTGMYLARGNAILRPDELARALSQGCGAVPTVAVVSACYSGSFATALAKPNRIVLTAARADRPSFGCQSDRRLTFFDECLLTSLSGAATWRGLADATGSCVSGLETALQAPPSEPQSSFGADVANLPLHF